VANSPSSSVQRARQQLAEQLRDIRLDAGLTVRALSAAAGWHVDTIAELLASVQEELDGPLAQTEWADDEISQAITRHPQRPTTCSTPSGWWSRP